MVNDQERSNRKLTHYHACVHCGSLFRKEDFDAKTIATGLYPCAKCGLDGPLNIVIQRIEDSGNENVSVTDQPVQSSIMGSFQIQIRLEKRGRVQVHRTLRKTTL